MKQLLLIIRYTFNFLLMISLLPIYSENVKDINNTKEAELRNGSDTQKKIREEKKLVLAIGYSVTTEKSKVKPYDTIVYNFQFQYHINSFLSFSNKFAYSKTSDGKIDLGHFSALGGVDLIEEKENGFNAIFNPTLKFFIFKSIYIGVGVGRNFGSRNYRGIRYSSEGEPKDNFFNVRPYETYHLEYEPYNFYSSVIGYEQYKEDGLMIGFGIQASSIINEQSKRKAYYTYEPGVILFNDKISLAKLLFLNTFTKYDPETKNYNNPVPIFYFWGGMAF